MRNGRGSYRGENQSNQSRGAGVKKNSANRFQKKAVIERQGSEAGEESA